MHQACLGVSGVLNLWYNSSLQMCCLAIGATAPAEILKIDAHKCCIMKLRLIRSCGGTVSNVVRLEFVLAVMKL